MPIRPENRARYPKNWREISARIRARSGGRCECLGECGLHQSKEHRDGCDIPRRCVERHGEPAKFAKGKVVLTVAHLADPSPENCADDNLKAMCQRCHLRYDHEDHMENARTTRRAKLKNRDLPLEG